MLTKLMIPTLKSTDTLLTILMISTKFLITAVEYKASKVSGELIKNIMERNTKKFWKYLLLNIRSFAIISFLAPSLSYLEDSLALRWREKLTKTVHQKYYGDMNYYKMSFLDNRVKNPDQRITEDIQKFSQSSVDMGLKIISPLINFLFYTYQLLLEGGWTSVFTTIGYMVISVQIILRISPNFGKLVSEQSRLEGNFRSTHTRIRTHAESIAVYNGDEFEKNIANEEFDKLKKHTDSLIKKQWWFGIMNGMLFKYGVRTIGWVILGIPAFTGGYDGMTIPEIFRAVKINSETLLQEFYAIGDLLLVYKNLLNLSGYTARVAAIFNLIKEYKAKKNNDLYRGTMIQSRNSIKFENVKIVTPANITLATNMNFEVVVGKNTIITGPNGAGKSSLFRVLGGLWPLHEGTISKPGAKEGLHADVFYVPQKPYNCVGSLRDQISYPTSKDESGINDAELKKVLGLVHLDHFVEDYGLKKEINWSTISIGEQQKLAMARLFYHHPKFAILDECTSGVTLKDEKLLYDNCKKLKITCITISHRPALMSYHDFVLKFDGCGGHSYGKIEHKK